jgi:hypothetical protein
MNLRPQRHRGHRAISGRIAGLVALVFSLLLALPASAGTLHTTDDAGVFTPAQLTSVRSRVQAYDFDVRVITTSTYASKSDLGDYVHRFVTEPNLLVIGLDPVHRHVSVHFGTGTRIADSEFKTIEAAGVAAFKNSDWAGGVISILDRAERAVGTGGTGGERRMAPVSAPSGGPTTDGHTARSSGGLGFLGILGIVGLVGGLIWLIARRRTNTLPPGGYGGPPVGGGYGGPPIGGGGYVGPPVGGYGGQPMGGPAYGSGGGSGIGGNIVAAGLGGLVGYEIGKEIAGRHERRDDYEGERGPGFFEGGPRDEPEPPPEWTGGGDSAEPGNYDAGGASGGWDDSSSGGSGDGDSGGGDGGGDADF